MIYEYSWYDNKIVYKNTPANLYSLDFNNNKRQLQIIDSTIYLDTDKTKTEIYISGDFDYIIGEILFILN